MEIYPDCGYFNEEKCNEYAPYPCKYVVMDNIDHLTTEQVENKPIKDENGVTIGRLTGADEDLIYGIVFGVSSIYKDATPASWSI